MAKYSEFSELLENRIQRGDYAARELPTELQLAEEFGASRNTARRAILELIKKRILIRQPYGRLAVNKQNPKIERQLQLAFLGMAFQSQNAEIWRFAVDRAAKKIGAVVRPVDYVHWDDPVINETLEAFDGVFLMPSSELIPPPVLERFRQARHLISLEYDFSEYGVPSVSLFPSRFVHHLGDHLYQLGHRHIDCLNTQPNGYVIQERAGQWALWKRLHRVQGTYVDRPVQPYENHVPKAYEVMKDLLDRGEFSATAIICLTHGAAMGAVRALVDHGVRVGTDVSVCAIGGDTLARYQTPSHTVLETPNPDVYVEACVDWFNKRTEPWVGPLLMEPSSASLFEGESTGPVSVRAMVEV